MLVQVMPDDHSKSVPPLPIPNRTVKRLCADDSAATSVKVGYRQASYIEKPPPAYTRSRSRVVQVGVFCFLRLDNTMLFKHQIASASDALRTNNIAFCPESIVRDR